MNIRKLILTSFLITFLTPLFAQETITATKNEISTQKTDLPTGYKGINLGMSLEETKESLIKNPEFGYNGDRDVSLIPGDNQILIETDATKAIGSVFLTQCWFQFYNENLYIITININTQKMDYYTMFTTLCNKYGEPKTLDPKKAIWENDDVILILEKPLSLKYINKKTYSELQNYANIQISAEELSREMFLEEF